MRVAPPVPVQHLSPAPPAPGRVAAPLPSPLEEGPAAGRALPAPERMAEPVTVVGLDFGTSTTLVSIGYASLGQPNRVVRLSTSQLSLPSEVAFEPDGRVLIGDTAGASPNAIVARSVKRCLACTGRCRESAACWSGGAGQVVVAGQIYTTKRVIELIVQRALDLARAELTRTSVTWDLRSVALHLGCPVDFTRAQRERLLLPVECATERHDLTLTNIIAEPAAAAVAFSHRENLAAGLSVIVDFGGGSLDLALINVETGRGGQSVENIAYAGDPILGGDDVDAAVATWLQQQLAAERGLAVEEVSGAFDADHYARRELWRTARTAKEALSRRDSYLIRLLEVPVSIGSGPWQQLITAEILATQARPVLQKVLNTLTRLFRAGNLFPDHVRDRAREHRFEDQIEALRAAAQQSIAQVVLVGGSCHLRCVRDLMIQVFGKKRILSERLLDPTQAVALGLSYGDEEQIHDALRPSYTIELHLYDKAGQLMKEPMCLYRAFEPIYEWRDTMTRGNTLAFDKSYRIDQACTSAEVHIRDAADDTSKQCPITPPQGRTVRITIDARTSLLQVSDGHGTLFERFLTHYGQRRYEAEEAMKAEARRREDEKERRKVELALERDRRPGTFYS